MYKRQVDNETAALESPERLDSNVGNVSMQVVQDGVSVKVRKEVRFAPEDDVPLGESVLPDKVLVSRADQN